MRQPSTHTDTGHQRHLWQDPKQRHLSNEIPKTIWDLLPLYKKLEFWPFLYSLEVFYFSVDLLVT